MHYYNSWRYIFYQLIDDVKKYNGNKTYDGYLTGKNICIIYKIHYDNLELYHLYLLIILYICCSSILIIYTTCPMDGSHECRLWRRPSLSLYVKDNSYLKAVRKRQQLLKSNIVLRLVVGSCYKADFPDHISVTFYGQVVYMIRPTQ
jgi:hypothetical protein